MSSPIAITAYIALFAITGFLFLFANLVIGWLVRPRLPNVEKLEVYECGEPTIGSSYVQFDLRFYVVALLFIIFDVEVAFFFPWAMIYGDATQLADSRLSEGARAAISSRLLDAPGEVVGPGLASQLLMTGLFDILVFFGVLLVGFAYVWKRGDLDWVRAVSDQVRQAAAVPKTPPLLEPSREVEHVG